MKSQEKIDQFLKVIESTYEKGMTNPGISLDEFMKELINSLKAIV